MLATASIALPLLLACAALAAVAHAAASRGKNRHAQAEQKSYESWSNNDKQALAFNAETIRLAYGIPHKRVAFRIPTEARVAHR